MKTRVYKNLNNGMWSLKQRIDGKWVVIGHAKEVGLINCEAYVSDARHNHVRSGNHREVFAWIVGDLHHVEGFESFRGRELVFASDVVDYGWDSDDLMPVTFHPFDAVKRGFYWAMPDGEYWDDFDYAYRCYFDSSSKCWGYA